MLAFVRHGQTGANRSGLLQGRSDLPLTDLGREQGERVAAALVGERPVRVFTSPLRRAFDTAVAIGAAADVEVTVDDRLIELDYGEWEQRPLLDVDSADWARWRGDPSFAPPGGESLRAVSERVASFCRDQLDGDAADGLVVAVSHVSPIKAAVIWALAVEETAAFRMFLELASITRVAARPGGVALVSFNEVAHLRDTSPDAVR
ncbi:MAG TPA: histidine phosphatase family protein [Acidimicrobiia bacterium]|nr:histidine phosphatase family protein [Acidimicrobiia bacterium]